MRLFSLGALAAFLPCIAMADYGAVTVSRVVSVYDADTFRVDIDDWPAVIGKNMSIRVLGVDAPEIRGKCAGEKERAIVARDFVRGLLAGADHIQLHNLKRGKYFRLLARVSVDGQDLGELLISQGYAREYGGRRRGGWCSDWHKQEDAINLPSSLRNLGTFAMASFPFAMAFFYLKLL